MDSKEQEQHRTDLWDLLRKEIGVKIEDGVLDKIISISSSHFGQRQAEPIEGNTTEQEKEEMLRRLFPDKPESVEELIKTGFCKHRRTPNPTEPLKDNNTVTARQYLANHKLEVLHPFAEHERAVEILVGYAGSVGAGRFVTDEEIETEAKQYESGAMSSMAEIIWFPQGFIEGAKWLRSQIFGEGKTTQT